MPRSHRCRLTAHGVSVDIQRSDQTLLIKIPATNRFQLVLLIPLAFILSILGPVLATLLGYILAVPTIRFFAAVLLVIVAGATYWELLPTFIRFERDTFSIYKSLANTSFELGRGSIQHIENVFQETPFLFTNLLRILLLSWVSARFSTLKIYFTRLKHLVMVQVTLNDE